MFIFEEINNKKILKSDILTQALHFFTTRESVVTPKDKKELISRCKENIRDLAQYLDIDKDNIIIPQQTHSCNIALAKKGHDYPNTDALVLTDNNLAILLNFADCTPVILYDEKNNIGAISHAGWRGTAAAIVPKTIEFMNKVAGTIPENIIAVIGPAISMKNYEVDESVFLEVKNSLKNQYSDFFKHNQITNKYNIDLKTVNYHQLRELGVVRIDKCEYCTYDSVDVFFSYRKESGNTARHSAVLKLVKQ